LTAGPLSDKSGLATISGIAIFTTSKCNLEEWQQRSNGLLKSSLENVYCVMLQYAVQKPCKSDSDNIKLEVGEPIWYLAILVYTKHSDTMDGSQSQRRKFFRQRTSETKLPLSQREIYRDNKPSLRNGEKASQCR
jgi:hypothetical protein